MTTIKIKAISVNQIFQGRRYKTKKYDDFITEFLYLVPKYMPKVFGNVRLKLNFYIKCVKTTDVSNLVKATEDCIVKAGLIEDDRFIYELDVKKFKAEVWKERIEFEITPIEI